MQEMMNSLNKDKLNVKTAFKMLYIEENEDEDCQENIQEEPEFSSRCFRNQKH